MRQIECLQAGRAIAALAVVAHHANLAARDFGGWNLPLIDYGWLGVDFFFVLSGFIIAHSSEKKMPRQYASARIRRVFLPYLPIGLGIALLYMMFPTLSAGERGWSWLPTLTLFPIGDPALSVAWTLQHEIMFYIIFGLLLFTGTVRTGLAIWALLIGVAMAAGWDSKPFLPINLEFIAGVLAQTAFRRNLRGWWLWPMAAIFLSAWLVAGATRELSFLVGLALAPTLVAVVNAEKQGKIAVHPALLYLGAASYSIYLAHGLAISVLVRLGPPALIATCFVGGTLAGIAYFVVVERPLTRAFREKAVAASDEQGTTS